MKFGEGVELAFSFVRRIGEGEVKTCLESRLIFHQIFIYTKNHRWLVIDRLTNRGCFKFRNVGNSAVPFLVNALGHQPTCLYIDSCPVLLATVINSTTWFHPLEAITAREYAVCSVP